MHNKSIANMCSTIPDPSLFALKRKVDVLGTAVLAQHLPNALARNTLPWDAGDLFKHYKRGNNKRR